MRYFVTFDAREIAIDVTALPDGRWDVPSRGRPALVEVVSTGWALSILVDGRVIDLELSGTPPV